jgi:hypothetical protein
LDKRQQTASTCADRCEEVGKRVKSENFAVEFRGAQKLGLSPVD